MKLARKQALTPRIRRATSPASVQFMVRAVVHPFSGTDVYASDSANAWTVGGVNGSLGDRPQQVLGGLITSANSELVNNNGGTGTNYNSNSTVCTANVAARSRSRSKRRLGRISPSSATSLGRIVALRPMRRRNHDSRLRESQNKSCTLPIVFAGPPRDPPAQAPMQVRRPERLVDFDGLSVLRLQLFRG